jgi:hypothetical protein
MRILDLFTVIFRGCFDLFSTKSGLRFIFIILFFHFIYDVGLSQTTENISSGSFIVNMGISNQTENNALKPYGLIYDLTKNYQVPVKWVINPTKGKDGDDFVVNGTSYRGGCFIIPAEFRTSAVNARITHWQSQGVSGVTINTNVTVPVYATIRTAVRWTLDDENGDIAKAYLDLAGIPTTAYDWVAPSALNGCNDIFVMPHAEPTSGTHSNLVTWNNVHRGSIWVGCKAGSETENNVGKFLSSTGCVPAESHDDLSGNVLYDHHADPVMQFLSENAHLATKNGAEQIYYPLTTWRPTTKIGMYQESPVVSPNQRKALIAYGRGFGDNNRGWVCMTAGHRLNDATAPKNIAAMRTFFNFSLLAAIERTVRPTLTGVPDIIISGTSTPMTFTLDPPGGSYSVLWTSSCGGTFSPNTTSSNVSYTPPPNATSCIITAKITDACGRIFYDSKFVTVQCQMSVTRTLTHVPCFGGNSGSISLNVTGSPGPYTWNWTRTAPAGSGSGSGITINGLSAGNYQVTVTSASGCVSIFNNQINQENLLTLSLVKNDVPCGGPTGNINLSVNGGNIPYSFLWSGPSSFSSTSQNLSNLTLGGTYTVTVTDANNCTSTTTTNFVRPTSVLSVSLTSQTIPSCYGGNNGAINVTVSGGYPAYSYLWSNGAVTEDLSSITSGTYSLTVTDIQGCKAYLTVNLAQLSPLVLTSVLVHPDCPPGVNPPAGNNGSINLTVTGGTSPYVYNWVDLTPPPVEPQDRSNLAAGTYSVTVTDARGCTKSLSMTLVNTNSLPNIPSAINH